MFEQLDGLQKEQFREKNMLIRSTSLWKWKQSTSFFSHIARRNLLFISKELVVVHRHSRDYGVIFIRKIPEQRILIPHSTWINAKHIPILFVFIPDIGSASGISLSKNGGCLIYFVFDHICIYIIYDVWLFGQPISYGFLLFIYMIYPLVN